VVVVEVALVVVNFTNKTAAVTVVMVMLWLQVIVVTVVDFSLLLITGTTVIMW